MLVETSSTKCVTHSIVVNELKQSPASKRERITNHILQYTLRLLTTTSVLVHLHETRPQMIVQAFLGQKFSVGLDGEEKSKYVLKVELGNDESVGENKPVFARLGGVFIRDERG